MQPLISEVDHVLVDLDVEINNENREQLRVLLEAFMLYVSRGRAYGDVWKQYGAINNLVRSATKVDRLMESWWHGTAMHPSMHKSSTDDAIDAINYMAFFIRLARQGNFTGDAPERPDLKLV